VSLIGMLEQLNLSSVLERIETHTKTGLLAIKQEKQWVELYFRDGRLMCVGPVRTDANLGERLLRDGVISSQALQEALFVIGSAPLSETRIALTLMDLGYVKREDLRAWATQKAAEIVRVLLTWSTGEIHFEENTSSPAERLLVSLSITSLLSSLPTANSTRHSVYSEVAQSVPLECAALSMSTSTVPVSSMAGGFSQAPMLFEASQFFTEPPASPLPVPSSPNPYISAGSLLPAFDAAVNTGPAAPLYTPPPMAVVPVTTLPAPKRVDISFMKPEMVLVPADLSPLREQHVQLTPEHWRLLTRVDGCTSLQDTCYALAMSPEQVCQVAGELIAANLIHVVPPSPASMPVQELSPVSRELVNSGLSNGHVAPGYAATTVSPWGTILPVSDVIPQFSPALPYETQSQWGNGGNGATFVPGQGWVTFPQPLQPLQPTGPFAAFGSGIYASVGGGQ